MTAEEILNEFIKGDIARDYSKEARKQNTITLDTAIKAIEVALNSRKSYAESLAKERAVEILKWMASYEIHDDHNGADNITLIDGVYYWDGDTDGDAPLSEEKIYEIYTAEDTFLAEKRKERYTCPDCCGDGIETCHNPDHGFLGMIGYVKGNANESACPCCGHSQDHKMKGVCETCNGKGTVNKATCEKYIDENSLDVSIDDYKRKEGTE